MTTKLHLDLIPWGCKARGVVHNDYIVLHFQKNTTLCKIGKSRAQRLLSKNGTQKA